MKKKKKSNGLRSEWAIYKQLKNEAYKAFDKLQDDFMQEKMPEVIIEDLNKLRYCLGECNWKIRELERARPFGKKAA